MICKKCLEEIAESDFFPNDHRYCIRCGTERSEFLKDRRATLTSLREMNLPSKIIQTKFLIRQAVFGFGLNKVYISYLGGKDSTVLSHIAKSMYPDTLHLFSNTPQTNTPKPYNTLNGSRKKTEPTLSWFLLLMFTAKPGLLKKL